MGVGLIPALHRCSGDGNVNRVRGSSAKPMKGHAGRSGASRSELTMGRDHRAKRAAGLAPRTTEEARNARRPGRMVPGCNRVATETTRAGALRY
jgi:hypothetical protein